MVAAMNLWSPPSSLVPAIGFFTERVGDDWTVSWSDLVSHLLFEAEARFGKRDQRWFFTGIEFDAGDVPMTYYPGNRPFHVGIRLTHHATTNAAEAYFQLAHEVVHLLGPSPERLPANVFEEGIATAFQVEVSALVKLGRTISLPSYVNARAAVLELLAHDRDAVKKVRTVYPDLRHVTVQRLLDVTPSAPQGLAERLCAPFQR